MNISEDTLVSWAQGPSKTESDRCDNAENAIKKAIAADNDLSKLNISVFAQGSYKARTNIRQNSDVDICVRYNDAFFADYPPGKGDADFGNIDGKLLFSDYKEMVERALRSYFGTQSISRGNKAIDVHANTYRVDADVVPTFERRRYTGRTFSDGSAQYLSGVAFIPDKGGLIENWPQQNYDNGVSRNDETGRSYKRVIRIIKRLRDRMQDDQITGANDIASFLIESLVWNAPIEAFQHDTYTADLRYVIADIWNRTRKDEDCSEWGEVNELKYLFRPSQPWSRQQANQFLQAAWDYVGFK
jgi:Second Messenger Oligonucleotide or Dinucleotide Synthetase domain